MSKIIWLRYEELACFSYIAKSARGHRCCHTGRCHPLIVHRIFGRLFPDLFPPSHPFLYSISSWKGKHLRTAEVEHHVSMYKSTCLSGPEEGSYRGWGDVLLKGHLMEEVWLLQWTNGTWSPSFPGPPGPLTPLISAGPDDVAETKWLLRNVRRGNRFDDRCF